MHDMSNTRKEIAARLGFAAGNGAKAEFAAHPSWSEGVLGKDTDPKLAAYSWISKNNIETGRKQMLLADLAAGMYEKNPSMSIAQAVLAAAKDMVRKGVATRDIQQWAENGGKFARPGAKVEFAGDIETKLRSLISRFGFKPDKISVSDRFGVAHVEFIDQKGKATEMVSKLKGAMKQMGVPESAIKARENQYPADQDGPAQHIGMVTIDFGQMKASRPGAKATMTREQTEEQKAGLKIMSAADAAVGAKIAKLIKEGKPQDQAVAIALDMKRRGEI